MKIAIFLEVQNNHILPVGFELIGKTIDMMADKDHCIHGILVKKQNDHLSTQDLNTAEAYLDEMIIYEYDEVYLTTEHYADALTDYVKKEKPEILLLGATALGRSFGPGVAATFKTGMTADCTEIKYDKEYGLIQIRPAYGEEILAEIVTPNHLPQMATIRPGVMDPPTTKGGKKAKKTLHKKSLVNQKLSILKRTENKQTVALAQAKLVVVAGNAIKEKEDLELVKKLAEALGGEYGVTRPLVEGGLAPHDRQVGVSGVVLSASIVLLLGVSGSNQTLSGIEKANKIIAVNNDPEAKIFKKVDLGIVDDWKGFTTAILNKKEKIKNGKD